MLNHIPLMKRAKLGGFTLIELLVSVFISVTILIALYMVFDRVQLVFRKGHGQSHVLERGRALMDMLVRDLETITPSDFPTYNLVSQSVNHTFLAAKDAPPNMTPAQQGLYMLQTEPLHAAELCAVGFDGGWKVFGYGLYSLDSTAPLSDLVGSLWRYEKSLDDRLSVPNAVASCIAPAGKFKFQKVAGGIIHLRVRAFAQPIPIAGSTAFEPRAMIENPAFELYDVPTHVEVELGLVEERLLAELANIAERFDAQMMNEPDSNKHQAIQNQKINSQRVFLTSHLDRVHMFRQLVAIKNRRVQ